MRNAVKISVFALILVFCAAPLFAQPGQGQRGGMMTEEGVKARIDNLATSLKLSDKQKKEILDFELAQMKKFQAEREKNAGNREAMRSIMEKSRKERNDKYTAVFTPEQMQQYNKMMEERAQQRQGQGGPGQGRPGQGQNPPPGQRGRPQ